MKNSNYMSKHPQIMKCIIIIILALFILVVWIIYNNIIAPYKLNIKNDMDAVFIIDGNTGASIELTDDAQVQELLDTINSLALQKTYKQEASTGWHVAIVIEKNNKNHHYVVNSQEIIYNDYIYTNPDSLSQINSFHSELCKLFD